ncbi:hypothetical protein GmHk_05G014031 [Glycine max]|nr:hypothetical protein GmHk_05G014031 [Glycine max]
MWVFYLISLPLTVGMTISSNHENGGISFFWNWSYWSTFLLKCYKFFLAVVPLIQGFEDAGDFTVSERLKTGLHVNLIFYLIVGSIGHFGFILLIMMHERWLLRQLLPSVDLSLFSILIKSVGTQEVLVLTSSVSLLMICSLIARYAPPISFNFFNLIRLGSDKTTIFEQQMGNIDNAVPFFGDKFNRIYPLIMVIYTLLVASNFFDRVFDSLGSWKRYVFETEAEDMGGFDPSGLIILQKERYWLEQGRNVGEQVVPPVRNFNGIDVESSDNIMVKNGVEMKGNSSLVNKEIDGNLPKTLKEETRRYSSSREAISSRVD